jgi:membrane fusion protein, heavy metal efflux system
MTTRVSPTVGILALVLACAARPPEATPAPPQPPGEVNLPALPGYMKVSPVALSTRGAGAEATGRVTFDEERVSRVASPVSGRVVELLARPGDAVKKGQPLLAIASPDAEAALSDLTAAEADERLAQKSLDRARRLYADQAIPHKDVLAAESDAVKARAILDRVRTRIEVLGLPAHHGDSARARFALRAPIAGVVVERPAQLGMEVRADSGTPLVTVADLSRLWVLADVYERDLGLVAKGERAEVRVPAYPAQLFAGQVTNVGELVDPITRTVKVRIEVSNPQAQLKPEMFARVTLLGGREAASLTVPEGAVLSDGQANAVIVAEGGGRFVKRLIEAGPEQDGQVRVLAGLREGEQVVVEGALFLKAEIESR